MCSARPSTLFGITVTWKLTENYLTKNHLTENRLTENRLTENRLTSSKYDDDDDDDDSRTTFFEVPFPVIPHHLLASRLVMSAHPQMQLRSDTTHRLANTIQLSTYD